MCSGARMPAWMQTGVPMAARPVATASFCQRRVGAPCSTSGRSRRGARVYARQMRDKDGVEFIRLESFIKLQGFCDTGGQAKMLIASGAVAVNGEVDVRRGRKLRHGDAVALEGVELEVEFFDEEAEE